MEEREYWFWLQKAFPMEAGKALELVKLLGSPEAVFRETELPISPARAQAAEAAKAGLAEELKALETREKEGIRWCCLTDETYPKRLRSIPDPPLGLFYRGKLPPEDKPSVSIVGARSCSAYGRGMAEYFGAELAKDGVSIVSGMAMGIDGHAQGAALRAGGASFAVLGCGADIAYPALNRGLYERLTEQGGVISEYLPGTPPLPVHFPYRNRIISGLSDLLLVLEAREKSGSLITVDQALEQGREVMALPGRVGDALSEGCNRLIRQGAGLLSCLGDVYEALGMENPREVREEEKTPLSEKEQRILALLSTTPTHRERLLQEGGLSFGELALTLLSLEERGLVRPVTTDQYVRR